MDRGAGRATVHGVTELDTTELLNTVQHSIQFQTILLILRIYKECYAKLPLCEVEGYIHLKRLSSSFSLFHFLYDAYQKI